MKRLVIIAIISMIALSVSAQDYLGIQFGYAQPTTRLNAPKTKTTLTPTSYNGFKVGLVYEAVVYKGFGVSLGLNYTFGANATDWLLSNGNPINSQDNNTPKYPQTSSKSFYHQLEIPIDWQYKFEIAKETWVIIYTGPTLQCGLAFNNKQYKKDLQGVTLDKTNNLFSVDDMKDYALKRINVTWGFGAGFQYQRYFLRGGYDLGIINPYKASQFDQVVGQGNPRTRGRFDQWQIKIGMYLWQSK